MPAKGHYKNPVCDSCGKKKPTDLRSRPKCKACRRVVSRLRAARKRYRKKGAQLRANNRARWRKNAARESARRKRRYRADGSKDRARAKRYYRKNRKQVIARVRERERVLRKVAPEVLNQYSRNSRKRAPHKHTARAASRRAAQVDATPAWADRDAIDEIYALAELMTRLLGKKYVVDHVVPLRGKTVCGLHVPANLEVLTEEENIAKSNKHWPGMPDKSKKSRRGKMTTSCKSARSSR